MGSIFEVFARVHGGPDFSFQNGSAQGINSYFLSRSKRMKELERRLDGNEHLLSHLVQQKRAPRWIQGLRLPQGHQGLHDTRWRLCKGGRPVLLSFGPALFLIEKLSFVEIGCSADVAPSAHPYASAKQIESRTVGLPFGRHGAV